MDKVVRFEVPFDNKQRAMKFYTESFGWQLMDMPQMNYVIARSVETDDQQMPKERGAISGAINGATLRSVNLGGDGSPGDPSPE